MATTYNSYNYENNINDRHNLIDAAAALVVSRFIGYDGNYGTAGNIAAGVTHMAAANGDPISLTYRGIERVEIGASQTITVGDEIAVGTNGVGVEAADDDWVVGIALEAATTTATDNAFIMVELIKAQKDTDS